MGQPGRPGSEEAWQEEGLAALMLACPGVCRLALNFLLILSFFPYVVFGKTYPEDEPCSPPGVRGVGVGGSSMNM